MVQGLTIGSCNLPTSERGKNLVFVSPQWQRRVVTCTRYRGHIDMLQCLRGGSEGRSLLPLRSLQSLSGVRQPASAGLGVFSLSADLVPWNITVSMPNSIIHCRAAQVCFFLSYHMQFDFKYVLVSSVRECMYNRTYAVVLVDWVFSDFSVKRFVHHKSIQNCIICNVVLNVYISCWF